MLKSDCVFVYGTLQRGFGNHRVMEISNGRFIGPAETADKYPLTVEGLPYLHNFKGEGHHVLGEVYQVEDLQNLDSLEGHPHFYKREIIEVALPTVRIPCWAYFIQNSDKKTISDFDGYIMHKSYREARYPETSFIN